MNHDPTLDRLLDVAEAHARLILLTFKMPMILPSWIIITGKGDAVIRQTPFNNENEKLLAEFYIKEELKELEAKAYSFLGEAWMAHCEPDQITADERLESEWLRPLNRPDRIEVVSAIAANREQVKSRMWEIVRDGTATGNVKRLKQLAHDGSETFGGWMARLFE